MNTRRKRKSYRDDGDSESGDQQSEHAPGVEPAGSHDFSAQQGGEGTVAAAAGPAAADSSGGGGAGPSTGAERSGTPGARPRRTARKRDLVEESDDDDSDSADQLKKQLRTVTDEKEIKRIKRLLRNRVSAQQARERKKQYVHELERQVASKDEQVNKLQADLKKAVTANATLRRLILTMRNSGSAESAGGAQAAGSSGNGSSAQMRPAPPNTQHLGSGYTAQHAGPHGMAVPAHAAQQAQLAQLQQLQQQQQDAWRTSSTGAERHAEQGAMRGQAMAHMQSHAVPHRHSYPGSTQHMAVASPAVAPPDCGPMPVQSALPHVAPQSWRPNSSMHNYGLNLDMTQPPQQRMQSSQHGRHAVTSQQQPSTVQNMQATPVSQAMPAQRTSMQHVHPSPASQQQHQHHYQMQPQSAEMHYWQQQQQQQQQQRQQHTIQQQQRHQGSGQLG